MGRAVAAEILDPYAEALMSLAQSKDLVDRFGEEISDILKTLEDSADLQQVLVSPVYSSQHKKLLLSQIFGNSVHPLLSNFLLLLVDRKRIEFLAGIGHSYKVLFRALKKIELAEVTAAVELSSDQQRSVKDQVKAMTGAESVELSITLDPTIIGGIIIKVGSQVLDASIRGQLRRIGVSLNRASV
ncbi:ATP synthase F1 subunit delta [Prochlorothrix hollandica]|uniref:ATP synthase subunit delta n=1 Tax=Prochlorothrix hollandica PCC 9006 = CALU 1027 TaxID=317619 RepID=A0A0M2PUQ1_PROHO|nr:ATP synthase F1 subunit delta [Prochlorothrix hollandica]KKI98817.1 ATP synthase F0F1 subunit delta [Prochlorothrix hollandica PCC 9006 = CALU 1027]